MSVSIFSRPVTITEGFTTHLVAAIPNGLTVEYMPWSGRLFEEVPEPVKGELTVPRKPGLGLNFDRDAIRRYGVT